MKVEGGKGLEPVFYFYITNREIKEVLQFDQRTASGIEKGYNFKIAISVYMPANKKKQAHGILYTGKVIFLYLQGDIKN